ncbi:chemotaxis protein methyltransferase CheR [Gracilibacillus halotolerans]|uniref:protein-glutamate O-methyltransferase n=1 Tax=Gracilibacillus halotolerans TaxID=74386 RepID=A0A841RGA6_9BACI|nr:protein-glutamate O-methyltransferase CheR [Gracilibacillus halotolerans]MBB6511651.1 chemotaxis protein methyltransferase CheR [Gracilibacillus halotolerans]
MQEYQSFIRQVNKSIGLDLSLYKEAQMKRRLTSLRNRRGFDSFQKYFDAIMEDRSLMEEFLDKITINVSEFYRNPNRWKVLEDSIFPALKKKKDKIKIWSAACSTGEEPYTLSILAQQFWDKQNISIIATDIDDNVLSHAKQGLYKERALQEVSPNIKKKYFNQVADTYKISDDIKQPITFKKHNLLADTFPQNMDLIVCRNVLIYFTDEAKEELYNKFSNALSEDGIFFVGSTEQIFNPENFNLKVHDTFFYQKM